MDAHVKLGRIWGIPIGLHISWFLVFTLVTLSLASGFLADTLSGTPAVAILGIAVVSSLLFFGSVLAHELGHAWVALRNRVPVRSITLFIFGGVAQITREPRTPGAEMRIAAAGPLVSIGLGLLFGLVARLVAGVAEIAEPALWLSRINFMLAAFNLIPAFPLDGGRVFRAIVWAATGSMRRATSLAASSGQVFAVGFMGLGLLSMVSGSLASGLWLVFIGWFLMSAASAGGGQADVESALQGVKVGQLMRREYATVPAAEPLARVVEDRILGRGQRTFYVASDGQLVGMLTLSDVSSVPREQWSLARASDAMVPRERLVAVSPDTLLTEAMELIGERDVNQLPVVENGHLAGTLTRDQVLRYIRTRSELMV